jgi:type I restriction enzyme R subunit
MSQLLEEIIRSRKDKSVDYSRYLNKIVELVRNIRNPTNLATYPNTIDSKSKRALYDNLDSNEKAALKVNEAILRNKPYGWRGNRIKEKTVKLAIKSALAEFGIDDEAQVESVLALARYQDEY